MHQFTQIDQLRLVSLTRTHTPPLPHGAKYWGKERDGGGAGYKFKLQNRQQHR